MPSCVVCGNDVPLGGVCHECGRFYVSDMRTGFPEGKQGAFRAKPDNLNADNLKASKMTAITAACIIFTALFIILFFTSTRASVIPLSTPEEIAQLFVQNGGSYGEVIQRSQEKVVYDITGIMELPPVDNKETYVEWMANHTKEKPEYLAARWDLAYTFITTEELTGEPMIRAFLLTPREHFVREQNIGRAYEDTWLPIGYGATITDPDVVSMMTTSLKVEPQHKVLEIGTGSGYQSAILSHLSNYVYTIEIIEPLYQETDTLYKKLSPDYPTYQNIRRKLADGFYGWDEYAPFDRIIVTCAIDHLPPPLIKQLSNNGIIVVPIGPPGRQQIMQITKTVDENNNISLKRRDVYNGVGVKFIPFRDETGKSYSTSDS